jgi:hypothetical protein
MTSEDPKLPIEEIADNGEPLEPKRNRSKFISQAGVIVRDMIPISIREWNKPAAADVEDPCYVHQVLKDLVYDTLLSHFTLPQDLSKMQKDNLKKWTLMKMAEQFRNWKKKLWNQYEETKEDPDFTSAQGKKLEPEWAAFKAYRKSATAVSRSEVNKENAKLKIYHHSLGTGGYKSAIPKWLAYEEKLLRSGVRPQTLDWPERSKFWLFAHGAVLDPVTGKIVGKGKWKELVDKIKEKLENAIRDVRNGVFIPDREDDELTRALGNPEHVGRARGYPGGTTFKTAWPDSANTYRSRSRSKKKESARISELERGLKETREELKALKEQRTEPQQRVELDPQADVAPSQRRSSVGSTRQVDGPYPVDDITEPTSCELHIAMRNITLKVAVGLAVVIKPGELYHCGEIPDGYARVGVDEIMPGFDTLDLEFPGGDEEKTLADVKHGFALWPKKYIVFPEPLPRPPNPRSMSQPHQQSPLRIERDPRPSPSPPHQQSPHLPDRDPSPSPSPTHQQSPPLSERVPSARPSQSLPHVKSFSRKRQSGSPVRKKPRKQKTPPPTPKLPWEKTAEENEIACKEHTDAWLAGVKQTALAKQLPPPKFTAGIPQEKIDRFFDAWYNPPPPLPTDYARSIEKSYEEEMENRSKKGKEVAQLGEQDAQSAPPLKVDSDNVLKNIKVRDLVYPGDDIPFADVVATYVPGENLLDGDLPTRMRQLQAWYKNAVKEGKHALMLDVKEEHYFQEYSIIVLFSEFFQLYNLRALDKSIISAYCL